MKFKVKITETNEKVVTVNATSPEEAQKKAADEYYLALDDKYVLTADNHKSTDFKTIVPDYCIGDYDKIAAVITVDEILNSYNAMLLSSPKTEKYKNSMFILENSIDADDCCEPFHKPFKTLYDVVNGSKQEIIQPFIDAFYQRLMSGEAILKTDWDRKCVILLEYSDYFNEVLKSITTDWYIEHGYAIMEAEKAHAHDNQLVTYLVDKSIAYKIIGSQETYQMLQYDSKIFLAYGYNYLNKEEFINAIIRANGSYTEEVCSKVYCFYSNVIKGETLQIEQDIDELGMKDMYLSAIELDYIGIAYPERYEITATSNAYDYNYAIWDHKKDCYAEDAGGNKYLSDSRKHLSKIADELNIGGWY